MDMGLEDAALDPVVGKFVGNGMLIGTDRRMELPVAGGGNCWDLVETLQGRLDFLVCQDWPWGTHQAQESGEHYKTPTQPSRRCHGVPSFLVAQDGRCVDGSAEPSRVHAGVHATMARGRAALPIVGIAAGRCRDRRE